MTDGDGRRRRGAAVRATVALACAATLAACTADDPAGGAADATSPPTTAASPAPGAGTAPSSGPVVTAPATPTTSPRPVSASALTWRTYLGASVPGGVPGPTQVGPNRVAGWRAGTSGAVFAAAHLAVALDPRQRRALWTAALAGAVPEAEAKRALARLGQDADAWDARLTADEAARSGSPSDTDVAGQPVSIWRPPVRVVGFGDVRTQAARVEVTVWSRTAGTALWRSRRVAVVRTSGDWRLRLPLPPWWRTGVPDASVRPISELGS